MSGMADSFVRTLSVFHNYLKSAELGEGAGGGGMGHESYQYLRGGSLQSSQSMRGSVRIRRV